MRLRHDPTPLHPLLPSLRQGQTERVIILKKVLYGLLAALTTPEAVKAEKSLLIIVLTRAAILVPSAAFILNWVIEALS